jgi:hypothetical protein
MATLPTATFSAPGVPLYAAYGTNSASLSTLEFANSYTWKGASIPENFVSFELSNVSTNLLQVGAANPGGGSLVADIVLNGSTGTLSIDAPGSLNLNTLPAGVVNLAALHASSISTNLLDCSGVSTSVLDIDGQALTANPTELLLNGIPVATTANLSSIQDWAFFPATSSITVSDYDIFSVNNLFVSSVKGEYIVSGDISTNTGYISTLVCEDITTKTFTALSTVSVISTISSAIVNAQTANINTISTGTISSGTLYSGDITTGSLVSGKVSATSISTSIVSSASLTVSSILGTPDITLEADAGSNLSIPEITVSAKNGTGGKVVLTADTGFGGTSFGAIELTANGGTTLGVGTGGSITLTANTPLGTLSNASSKISLSAAGINSYAGAIPPIGSLLGYNFTYGTLGINQCVGLPSVIPNFPGTLYQYAPGGAGYGGIRLESPGGLECVNNTDFYAYRIYPYYNPFLIGTYADLTITGRSNLVGNNQYLQLSSIRAVEFGFNETKGVINGLSSINGQPLSFYSSASSLSTFIDLTTSTLKTSSITDQSGYITLQAGGAGGPFIKIDGNDGPITIATPSEDITLNPLGKVIVSGGATISCSNFENVSSINGNPIEVYQNVSTFSTLNTLSLSTNEISVYTGVEIAVKNTFLMDNGATVSWSNGTIVQDSQIYSQLMTTNEIDADIVYGNSLNAYVSNFSSIQGTEGIFSNLTLTPSTLVKSATSFSQLEAYNPSNLSTAQIMGFAFVSKGNSTDPNFGAFTRATDNRALYIDSNFSSQKLLYQIDSNASISSLTVSSLTANVVSSLGVVASSLTLRAGTISSILFVSTASIAGVASNSLYLDSNSDFNVGNNNLLAGQIRLGFNLPSGAIGLNRRAELILYSQVKNEYNLNAQNQDRAIRTATTFSTLTAADEGYILDTRINPPILSTLNNTSTALMAFFPSTNNSTIGISTISFMPPIQYYASIYSSTSQTVVGANTSTLATYNATSLNIGGFTRNANSITVPVGGTYEITTSFQFDTTSGGTNLAEFWFIKNGLAIPQTNSRVSITNNGDTLGTLSIFDTAAANDTYGCMFYSSDANMTAAAVAAGATPAIPSIILNVKRLGA